MSLHLIKQHTAGVRGMAPHILNLGIALIMKQILKFYEYHDLHVYEEPGAFVMLWPIFLKLVFGMLRYAKQLHYNASVTHSGICWFVETTCDREMHTFIVSYF